MPGEVCRPRRNRIIRQLEAIEQGRRAEHGACRRITLGDGANFGRHMDPQVDVDSQESGIESDVVRRTCGQAIPHVQALSWPAVLPWLDMTRDEHAAGSLV